MRKVMRKGLAFLSFILQFTSCIILLLSLSACGEYNTDGTEGESSWSTKSSMPTARSSLGVGVVNGILYAVGGYNGSYLSTVEAYDPATNTWSTKASMPTARSGLAIGVVNGILYAVGGYNGTRRLSTVEAYDP